MPRNKKNPVSGAKRKAEHQKIEDSITESDQQLGTHNLTQSACKQLIAIENDFTQCVTALYKLFDQPQRPFDRSGREVQQTQQCHQRIGANETRCTNDASKYAYFCDKHALERYPRLDVRCAGAKGLGLFAREAIAEGEVLAPYYGPHAFHKPVSDYVFSMNARQTDGTQRRLIVDNVENEKEDDMQKATYLNITEEYHINAAGTQTTVARYANHHSTNPNAQLFPVRLFGATYRHPCLQATCAIQAGAEICVDYGSRYTWSDPALE
jgi:hypothetical protein